MTRKVKIALGLGIALLAGCAAAAVLVYANLTQIVRAVVQDQVPGLSFKALDVGWNRVSLTDVKLERDKRVLFKVDSLRIYPSMWSIFSDALVISGIDIDRPYVYVLRNADGSLTLPGLEAGEKAGAKGDDSGSSSMRISIHRIRIKDGKGDFVDRSVYGTPAEFSLTDLQVSVDKVVLSARDEPIPFDVSARLVGKRTGKLKAKGWYTAATKSARLDLDVDDFFLPKSEPYYRTRHTTASLSDGVLQLAANVEMKNGQYDAKVDVTFGDIAFSREGLFLGVPVVLLQRHLRDQRKPFHMQAHLNGKLGDKSKLQQQLVDAVVQALAKEIGEQALSQVAEDLKRGDLPAAGESAKASAQRAGKGITDLFRR